MKPTVPFRGLAAGLAAGLACCGLVLLLSSCSGVRQPDAALPRALPASVEILPPAAYTRGTPAYEMAVHTAATATPGSLDPLGANAARMLSLRAYAHPGPAGGAAPKAYHMIPAAMNMGAYLPLLEPDKNAATGTPERKPRPVARLYWGGGEEIRPGQPKVVHTLASAGTPFPPRPQAASYGMAATGALRPGWKEAAWPSKADARIVPPGASLAGQHLIHGNFLPHMRFTMDQRHDFMGALAVAAESADLNGPLPVVWNALPNAVAYHVMALGIDETRKELVLWTSSENPDINVSGQFLDSRLAKNHTVRMITLSSGVTRCVIPGGVFAGTGTVMITVTAWGEDYLTGQPPRPAAGKIWDPDWMVKARFLSTGTLVLGAPGGAKQLRDLL